MEASRAAVPFVVLVVGRPASGKTTIAATIAERWGLPIVSKDAVKEVLFDELGTSDRDWSRKLGRAAFAVLDVIIELQLLSGRPFLVDAAYDAVRAETAFRAWQDRFGFTAVQVHCTASREELVRRFARRSADGSRHPGHEDARAIEEYGASLGDGRQEVLELRGLVVEYESERTDASARVLDTLGRILPAV